MYTVAFIAALVLFDLAVKSYFVATDALRWSQAVGSLVTLMTCWFLWRGSKVAYWFLVVSIAGGLLYAIWAYASTLLAPVAILCGFVLALLIALFVPATRRFLACQRAARA